MLFLKTITKEMEYVAEKLSVVLDDSYYLAGGTALALHIGHRESIDLDYFTKESIDTLSLKKKLFEVFSEEEVRITFEEKDTLWTNIKGVKVSFITRADSLLQDFVCEGVFTLASLQDLVVMKLIAVCGREEYKDYFDLAHLAKHTDVREWGMWWQSVYSNQESTSWLIALSAVDTIPVVALKVFGENRSISQDIKNIVKESTLYVEGISSE